ncbi:hypothetical protein P692DRAFT_201809320 [Suillus brevipes Sb2]|nr:hypothetical protein P692DRAFT_201809320 [Suillus brevipes Sb2]
MTSRRSLRLARNNQDSLSWDINETIDSIPSTPQRSRLQTAAYLLGARQDMPDLDDKEIKCARTVRLWYSSDATEEQPVDQQPLNKKDAPHRLLNSQDIASVFKNVRAEQMSGRKNKTVAIEIVNTMPMLKEKPTKQLVGKQNLAVSNTSPPLYTKELEHVKSRLCCSKHRLGDMENTATFCWADMSQPTAPHYPLCTQDLQEWAKNLYTNSLRERGILYLSTAANFDSKFYVEKVGMSEGAALTFHSRIRKAHLKEERAKARRKAKGKKKARDDADKENI